MPSSNVTFGLQTGQQEASWQEIRDTWLELEADGFDHLWVYDHFLPTGTRITDGPAPDGWTLLTALSQVVKKPRLGTLVTCMTFRHPVALAKIATSLDHVSNGRAILAVGAGWHLPEHEAYGIPLPPPKERVERFAEGVHIVKSLWTNDRTTFDGKYYQIKDAPFEPKPIQTPHPAIVIGGGGEKLTMAVAARYADEWNWNLNGTTQDYTHKLEVLREHCRKIGRNPDEIDLSLNVDFLISDDNRRIENALRVHAQTNNQTLQQARDATITGNPEEVIGKLQTYIDLGVRSFIFSLRAPYEAKDKKRLADLDQRGLRYHTTMDDVRRLVKEVLPALR
jgi:F420-dependent oxidoreductase-like protein